MQNPTSRLSISHPAAFLIASAMAAWAIPSANAAAAMAAPAKPNVLFIAVDDMRDWVGYLGGYAGPVHTPNLDALAARGVGFTNAHTASPLCNPSRTAVMSGRMPSKTGVYDNSQWWPANHPTLLTLPTFFRANGYTAVGAGKIYHHTAGSNPPVQWDAFQHLYFRESPWLRDSPPNYPWSRVEKNPPQYPFSRIKGLEGEWDWGVLPIPTEKYDDTVNADLDIDFLSKPQSKPFFLACGMFRPHVPWYTPQQFVDLYPLDQIKLPETKADDLNDIPAIGQKWAKANHGAESLDQSPDGRKRAAQAYLAAISFADWQVGRIVKQLDASPMATNTIIVLWSDHGWHLGEKGHWHKMTLWEEATRVPFVVVAPGVTPKDGALSARTVSLIDIFPTLASLCGLPAPRNLDGLDLTPLLKDPKAEWKRPAVIEFLEGNAAVRDERYRYIHYRDNTEELYDLSNDPHQWTNRASDPALADVKKQLARSLPKSWEPAVPPKGAFVFDPRDYSWKSKATGLVVQGKGPAAAMPVFQDGNTFSAEAIDNPVNTETER